MYFKIKRVLLANALSKCVKAVSVRSALPALTGIRFQLLSDCLVLTGSDHDLTIQTRIQTSEDLIIYKEGSIILSAKYIVEIVRKMNSEFIDIEIIDGCLTRIKGSNSEFNLNGSDDSDYPMIDLSKSETMFVMNSLVLKNIITQTKFAASDRETKPVLTGINFKATDHFLECIATDSFRLAKKVSPLHQDIQFNITIPQKSLDEISKLIEKEANLEIYVSDRKLLFIYDDLLIQTRLIDGSYPDTTRLIPSTITSKLEINSSDLLGAIDRVSLLSTEMNSNITLDMNEDSVVLSSNDQEIGSVEENLSDAFYKGEPLSISFNSKYATDAIRCFSSNTTIRISFTGLLRPFIITRLDDEDVIQLLLPVRTF